VWLVLLQCGGWLCCPCGWQNQSPACVQECGSPVLLPFVPSSQLPLQLLTASLLYWPAHLPHISLLASLPGRQSWRHCATSPGLTGGTFAVMPAPLLLTALLRCLASYHFGYLSWHHSSWTITLAGLISHCWTGWPLTGWTYCNKSSWHGGTSHHITGTIAAGGTYGLTAH
jgi:hypothetical protein